MVVKVVQDDILNTNAKHIAFAINTEGYNDTGFAGEIAKKYWNKLTNCGKHELGTVLSKKIGDITFHALVCHSLYKNFPDNQMEVIKKCFDSIPSNGEEIATIAIGTRFSERINGADFKKIVCGMHASINPIRLYSGYSLDDIISFFEEEKGKIRKKVI